MESDGLAESGARSLSWVTRVLHANAFQKLRQESAQIFGVGMTRSSLHIYPPKKLYYHAHIFCTHRKKCEGGAVQFSMWSNSSCEGADAFGAPGSAGCGGGGNNSCTRNGEGAPSPAGALPWEGGPRLVTAPVDAAPEGRRPLEAAMPQCRRAAVASSLGSEAR